MLPDIEPFETHKPLERKDDLFFCALGFEDRCLSIPEHLAIQKGYHSKKSIYFQYSTNEPDNAKNESKLKSALSVFSDSVEQPLKCDEEDFPVKLRNILKGLGGNGSLPSVSFDITVCSSKLLLTALKIILESDVSLRILYSEAAVYHPTRSEYEQDYNKWAQEDGLGLAKGVQKIIPSPEHPGNRRDKLPEAVIVFPTFRRERAVAAIADIDQSLITRPKDRIIWLIGKPHLPQDQWRTDALRKINEIPDTAPSYEVSTFDYKATIEKLESIYGVKDCEYHVNIIPLGSKLQSLGIQLFWQVRQDVSLTFVIPKKYNAHEYTEGCKAAWLIDFGTTKQLRDVLNSVGQLSVRE
jgi:hypothetical protein